MIGKRARRHRPSAAGYSSTRMGGAGGVNPRNSGEICMALVVVAAAACASSAAAAAAGSGTSPAFCSTMPQSAPFVRNHKEMVPSKTTASISQTPSFVGKQQISSTSNIRSNMHPLFSSLDSDDANFDESEWQAVTAALQMYKAAYGDLKVPSRFVVPSLPPWPGKFRLILIYVHCTLRIEFYVLASWDFLCNCYNIVQDVPLSQKAHPDNTHQIFIYQNLYS